jgi:hypothetical protein
MALLAAAPMVRGFPQICSPVKPHQGKFVDRFDPRGVFVTVLCPRNMPGHARGVGLDAGPPCTLMPA